MPTVRIQNEVNGNTFFITITTIEWINIFTSEKYFQILLEVMSFQLKRNKCKLLGYVIMTNHLHLIIMEGDTIGFLRSFKSLSTYKILNTLEYENKNYILKKLEGKLWQKTNMPINIYLAKFLNQKLEYIHNNPVKKGYVRNQEDWRYSSANNYINDIIGEIQIEKHLVQ